MRGKGKRCPHTLASDRRPVIQKGFALTGTKGHRDKSATLFTATDINTHMAMAIIVPSKRMNHYAFTEFKRFIYETRRTHAVLQTVDEPSIKALARACVSEIESLTMRVALAGSSQNQGAVGRFHQTLFAQVRTIRVAVASRLHSVQEEFQVDHPISPWIAQHSSCVLNRFLMHDDGLSCFHRLQFLDLP